MKIVRLRCGGVSLEDIDEPGVIYSDEPPTPAMLSLMALPERFREINRQGMNRLEAVLDFIGLPSRENPDCFVVWRPLDKDTPSFYIERQGPGEWYLSDEQGGMADGHNLLSLVAHFWRIGMGDAASAVENFLLALDSDELIAVCEDLAFDGKAWPSAPEVSSLRA